MTAAVAYRCHHLAVQRFEILRRDGLDEADVVGLKFAQQFQQPRLMREHFHAVHRTDNRMKLAVVESVCLLQ